MNSKILSYVAIATAAAGLVGFAFGGFELALFGVAVASLTLLIASTDYAARPRYTALLCAAANASERNPLAA